MTTRGPTTDFSAPRIVYAGDREIAVAVLDFMASKGVQPIALILPPTEIASHASQLREKCQHLDASVIFSKKTFDAEIADTLSALSPDYIVSVHFPHVIPTHILEIPRIASLNLHPAYLPYNRGWHTPSWAILDSTPYGATLHHMAAELDAGDIVHQKQIAIRPDDTAHTLYQRVRDAEVAVFQEAWPLLVNEDLPRIPQNDSKSTVHTKSDLFKPETQRIDRDEPTKAGALIDKLRALTTNKLKEAAYFEVDDRRYRVQIRIVEDS